MPAFCASPFLVLGRAVEADPLPSSFTLLEELTKARASRQVQITAEEKATVQEKVAAEEKTIVEKQVMSSTTLGLYQLTNLGATAPTNRLSRGRWYTCVLSSSTSRLGVRSYREKNWDNIRGTLTGLIWLTACPAQSWWRGGTVCVDGLDSWW